MNSVNYEVLHHFIEGLRGDFVEHGESPKSYQNAKNGRLYSHNGVIAYSSIKGTKEVYKNNGIVKYLGYWAFEDELIIFAKCLPSTIDQNESTTIDYETIEKLVAKTFSISSDTDTITVDLDPNVNLINYQLPVYSSSEDPLSFNIPFSCIDSSGNDIDFSEYYKEVLNENIEICQIENGGDFQNNSDYIDCIISLKKDDSGILYDEVLWTGLLNWPLDGKICAYGIYESNFYKRVYFTDYVNPFRVINLKDSNLSSRNSKEFQTFQSTALLQPKIVSINNSGELKAGSILYTYRLITDNGQITEFSPFSNAVKIVTDNDGYDYSGGDISEVTDKSVTIKCNIINWENYNEVECVAVEYEAFGSPTSIRSLGIKSAGPTVTFEHYGNEAEFSSDLTLSDLLERKNTWKYCSDLGAKKNKLLAIGLRNDPIPTELLTLNKFFTLHSWDINGETHECLINPKPYKYRYIDPTNTEKMFYVKQKLYNSIQVFGNFIITIFNKETGFNYSKSFESTSNQTYQEYNDVIFDWLNNLQSFLNFSIGFPNLKFEYISGKIVLTPIDENIVTDLSNVNFQYDTVQVIENIEEDIEFYNLSVSNNLVYGAVSLGFNQGNGIRITYQTEMVEVLEKATQIYPDSEPILDIKTPDTKKDFFKGEIYRLGLQIFDKEGYQLFTIPLGDLKIPDVGEQKKYIDDNGNVIIENTNYVNSKVIGNIMYAEKITLKVEVRLSCEIQKLVSMYQLVYVERSEDNRTILCQGISAPLERTNIFRYSEHVGLKDAVANKWNLPYYGGPTYDWNGLKTFDDNPNEESDNVAEKRIVTHRGLMYFDAPDLIFSIVSGEKIKNGSIQRIARLNTDHSRNSIRQKDGEVYPAFSRKIYRDEIDGEDDRKPLFINVSVFIEREGINDLINIEKAEIFERGQITPGSKLNVSQEVSNNALALQQQAWFYSMSGRTSNSCSGVESGATFELFKTNTVSIGFTTAIIKTSENVFTDEFINQVPFRVNPEIRESGNGNGLTYDTHGLFNVKLNNQESVYGGRSELSYSKNTYIPLGETIPVLNNSNNTQLFTVYGDSYTTLYIRNKNNFNEDDVATGYGVNNNGNCAKDNVTGFDHNGAWCYAVVLQTSVEPKWTDKETFYKLGSPFDFQRVWTESINEAYYQENTLRTYIPKPYNFQDDPNMGNIIAISDTKLSGDYIDSWASFRVNNFYELEKDKGVAYNLAKYLDNLYAIQEQQTSLLYIDENVMLPSSKGEISMQQGSGEGISNHQIISDYGTSIRRAIVEIISNSKKIGGFVFLDEHRFEWIKVDQPLLIERDLHLKMREIFEDNKIIDTEGYFDDEYKETNIRIRTKSGISYMLSFNEKIGVFNSWFDYDNDIYIVWNENIFAPKTIDVTSSETNNIQPDSSSLHQLNKGIFLNFFDKQETMKIQITANPNPESVKIFKHWAGIINTNYAIKNMVVKTSSGQTRVLSGLHYRYQIKEGRHSLPLKNRDDWEDLRGEWATLEIEIESENNKKVDVFSFINFVRHSYQ